MLKACQKTLRNSRAEADCDYPISIEYPFHNKTPRSNREYWKRFDEIFARDDVLCGILGMEDPGEHWITFENKRKTLVQFDSDARDRKWRVKKKDIRAGRYRRKKYIVNPRELVVFRTNDRG